MMVEKYACPRCGAVHDGVTAVYDEDDVPKEGDASICLKCGGLNLFTAARTLRIPTRDEFISMLRAPELVAALAAWHRIMEEQ